MLPVILFREALSEEKEANIAGRHFLVYSSRMDIHDSLVIGRYSVLPFYKELEDDLMKNGSRLINSYAEHRWIAEFEYYNDLKEFTFETWTDDDFYTAPEGKFVVKGKTNSRKHQWNTHMFAKDKLAAVEIASELINDGLIGEQGVLYRKYEPLVTFEIGVNDLPFTDEWRLFYYKDKLLSYGFYWSLMYDKSGIHLPMTGLDFAQGVAKVASQHATFFVLDIARKVTGEWVLVEVNDGQMSGLSDNDPGILYSNLRHTLGGDYNG